VLILVNLGVSLLTLLFLMLTTCKDPSYIKKGVEFIKLVEDFDAT
jgi:hypothetical protein